MFFVYSPNYVTKTFDESTKDSAFASNVVFIILSTAVDDEGEIEEKEEE